MIDFYWSPWTDCPAPHNHEICFEYVNYCNAIRHFNIALKNNNNVRNQDTDYWIEKIEQLEEKIFSLLDSLEGKRLLEEAGEVDRGPITEPAPLAEEEAPEEWKPLYHPPTSNS